MNTEWVEYSKYENAAIAVCKKLFNRSSNMSSAFLVSGTIYISPS